MRLRYSAPGSSGRLARLALPVVLVLGLFGCDDFLTTEPKAQPTTGNFFTTEAEALQATNATYAMLRNWSVHVFAYLGMTDIASDDATKGSVPADAGFLLDMDNLTFDAGNISFSTTWEGYYQGIYRANVAIANIPGVDMNPTVRERLVAENKFLRAYYYFFLVRAYGGVPLITAPLPPGEYFQERATREAVYDQIEQDLTDAIELLPERSGYSAADMGRATKGAARALLAKVHLFQDEFQDAWDLAEAVIGSGEYSLYPSYEGIFTQAGENSSETVFEVQVIAVEGGNNGASGGATQHSQVQGVRGFPNLGWGFNTPSFDLEASYEPGDPRLQHTILYPWEQLEDGSGTVVHLNASMPNPRFNEKVQVPSDNPGGSGNSGINIRLIRYADVLLMAAEAGFQVGQAGPAQDYLNMVRERAREGNTVTAGFTPELLDEDIATEVLGLPTDSRVFVRYVNPESSAAGSGVQGLQASLDDAIAPVPIRVESMDVITSVNANDVTTPEELQAELEAAGEGATVALTVLRVAHPEGGPVTTTPMVMNVGVDALLPDVDATGQALLDAIWRERRHELAMEQHRWFDIIRQGRAADIMAALGKNFIVGQHEVYPIPSGEVTIAGLEQNTGY